jgi:hypothetical protein
MATSHLRALPDFLIIGTQRGGTSALHRYLAQHSNVTPGSRKEVHFFDRHYNHGEQWYRSHFPIDRRLRSYGSITGEATANYLFYPPVPSRVETMLPSVRLIALLRNPVYRAHSAWRLMTLKGWEELSFEEAIASEVARIGEDLERALQGIDPPDLSLFRHSYLSRGMYALQLERWLEAFPREQFLVLKSEDLFERPEEVYLRVLEFLGLTAHPPPSFQQTYGAEGTQLDSATARRLTDFFRPHNERLYHLVGRDFEWHL